MKPKNIGFTILGKERDWLGKSTKKRWNHLRPSVAFVLQEERLLDRCFLAYQPGHESFRNQVCADIEQVLASRRGQRGSACSVVVTPISFKDPYDFDEVYATLVRTIELLARNNPGLWHLNVATGTHAMQFAMYFMADKRVLPSLPLRLIQPSPGASGEGRTTFGSSAKLIDISWDRLPELRQDFEKRRATYATPHTNNSDWKRTLNQIATLGIETDETLLFLGATGTGKSKMAGRVHDLWVEHGKTALSRKARESKPQAEAPHLSTHFVEMNCAGIRGDLVRSELFGHVKGAFTGATSDFKGVLMRADNGTLFLDEIGDLDLETQALLLKALETKRFSPVGNLGCVQESRFRLICATNHDLAADVAGGRFRLDLYCRLRNWEFHFRPLKELAEDMVFLTSSQLEAWCKRTVASEGRSRVEFKPNALNAFLDFAVAAPWPGNYRDFVQSINRMATWASLEHSGGQGFITMKIVEDEISQLQTLWAQEVGNNASSSDGGTMVSLFAAHVRETHPESVLIEAAECELQAWALEAEQNNQAKAARRLYGVAGKDAGTNPSSVFANRRRLIACRMKGERHA